MELWNDYEGKTVDGRYRLERLIGPKGRSAFFATMDEAGQPAVIRLIESLNDEEEILRRWRAVQELRQENLLRLVACDKTVLDGVHLVYAVMERADADLAEILRDRVLTADEAREMTRSVAAALEELHAHGLVHEHVEPANVVARGEVVKLRGDLVREAGDGPEAQALRKRDAHDLAVLIQESMTRRREAGNVGLPAPFDEIVRNGRSGTWGVGEMASIVRPAPVVPRPAEPAVSRSSPNGNGIRPAISAAAAGDGARSVPETARDAAAPPIRPRAPEADRILVEPEKEETRRRGLWAVAAVAFLAAVLLFWHFLHAGREPAGAGPVATAPAPTASPVAPPVSGSPAGPSAVDKPSAAVTGATRPGATRSERAAATAAAPAAATTADQSVPREHGTHADWRVVAFTYNHEEQARQKAAALAHQHPELGAEVFAPKGGAPYLVALGGWMSSGEASSMRARAVRGGLPHDTYVKNYKTH